MGRGSPFSSSFLLRLLWSGSREQFNVKDTGLDAEPQVQVPAVPQACVGTRLGMGLSPLSRAKIKAVGGLIPRAQGCLGYAEVGRTRGEAGGGFHSRHTLFAPFVPFCPQWEGQCFQCRAAGRMPVPSRLWQPAG